MIKGFVNDDLEPMIEIGLISGGENEKICNSRYGF